MQFKKILFGLFSLTIGFSLGSALFAYFLQFPVGSKRNLVFTIIIALSITAGAYCALEKFLFRSFMNYTRPVRWILILGSLFIGFWMYYSLAFDEHSIYLMLPDQNLDVTIPMETLPKEEMVSLQWFNIGFRDVSFSELQIEGKFNKTDEKLEFPGGQIVYLHWSGKTGSKTKLSFEPLTKPQEVQISWNGDERTIYLDQSEAGAVNFVYEFEKPLSYKLANLFLIVPGLSFCFLFIVMVLAFSQPTASPSKTGRYAWLLYAIPMLGVWGTYLLAFWPGMMNVDAFVQWGQGLRGSYNDWHPAIHTLLIHILNSIWYTPAVVAIVQIFICSLVVANGIGLFIEQGGAPPIAWLISLLMALHPTNGVLIISLWKDTPYAIAMLAFTIVIFRIVMTDGNWLAKRWSWLWLSLSGLFTMLLRHNGLPVTIVTIILLYFLFSSQRKRILISMLAIGFSYICIRGPLYTVINVQRNSSGQLDNILYHHLSAFVHAGTPLHDEEAKYLNTVLPLSEWTYNCCAKEAYSEYGDDFDKDFFYQNSTYNKKLVFSLWQRDPIVGIDHLLCANSMVWKIAPGCYQKGITLFVTDNKIRWLANDLYGLDEDSKIPDLANWLATHVLLDQHSFIIDVLLWKTPFYLLIIMIVVSCASLRLKEVKLWLGVAPVLIHSGVIFIINRIQSFRYQSPIIPIGIFLLLLIFLPKSKSKITITNE